MNKTKTLIGIAIAATLLLAASACQKTGNTNSAANQPAANANQAANTATPEADNTSTSSTGTPTDTYKAAYTARKNKDIAALKKLMAKDILEFLTDIGSAENKTLDDELKEMCKRPQAATSEARNEKINGDKAKIEYLDENGKWQTMDFVKEDGAWKLTIDKDDKGSPDDDKDEKDKK